MEFLENIEVIIWIRYCGKIILDGLDMVIFFIENIGVFYLNIEDLKVFIWFLVVRIIKRIIRKWNFYFCFDFFLLIVLIKFVFLR